MERNSKTLRFVEEIIFLLLLLLFTYMDWHKWPHISSRIYSTNWSHFQMNDISIFFISWMNVCVNVFSFHAAIYIFIFIFFRTTSTNIGTHVIKIESSRMKLHRLVVVFMRLIRLIIITQWTSIHQIDFIVVSMEFR